MKFEIEHINNLYDGISFELGDTTGYVAWNKNKPEVKFIGFEIPDRYADMLDINPNDPDEFNFLLKGVNMEWTESLSYESNIMLVCDVSDYVDTSNDDEQTILDELYKVVIHISNNFNRSLAHLK